VNHISACADLLPSAAASKVCRSLYRAYRAVRFYPPGHPVAENELAALAAEGDSYLCSFGSLHLEVQETAFALEGEVVSEQPELSHNLAFLLFRDGVRMLSLFPGLSREELAALVACLRHGPDVDRADQDLATILWEQDFAHVHVTVADPLLEGQDDGSGYLGRVREQTGAALSAMAAPDARLVARPVRPDLLTGLHPPRDRPDPPGDESGRIRLAADEEPDLLEQFGLVLGEVILSARREAEACSAAEALGEVLLSYLEWGQVSALVTGVQRLQQLRAGSAAREPLLTGVLSKLRCREALQPLLAAADGPRAGQREAIEHFLCLLLPEGYPVLLELLTDAEGIGARKCLLNVLSAGDGVPLGLVVRHLSDPRWFVTRNMVFLLGALADPAAIGSLASVLEYPDERVRREAIRSLTAIGGEEAAQLVAERLHDPAASVRIVAVRSLASFGRESDSAALIQMVSAKEFAGRDEAEVEAFFGVLGELASDDAVPSLEELWAGGSLFRSRPLSIRLLALKALGHIGTVVAQTSLRRALRSGDERLRRQAQRILAGSSAEKTAV